MQFVAVGTLPAVGSWVPADSQTHFSAVNMVADCSTSQFPTRRLGTLPYSAPTPDYQATSALHHLVLGKPAVGTLGTDPSHPLHEYHPDTAAEGSLRVEGC